MGLAEGFASGYGLVDAALQRRHANELEEQKIAQDRLYKEREFGLKDAELGIQRQKANTDASLADVHGKYYQSQIDNMNFDNKLKRDQFNESTRRSKVEEGFKGQELGIHKQNADTSFLGAKATADYHETQRLAAEQKRQQEERLDSARQLQSYFVADPNTGDFKINMMPGEEGRVVELAKKGLGRDLIAIGRNLPEYQQHLNVMKDAAMNPGKYAGNNPNLINAFNAFNGPDLQKGVGEVDKDGNVIESKKAAGIIFHPDESDPTNVDKGYYTVALEVSGKTKDGKPFSRIAPMTQYRSADEANDQNVRVFTHDQFVRLVDGDNGVVNILLHKPEFTRSLVDSATNMTGDNDKDGKLRYQFIKQEGEDGDVKFFAGDRQTGETKAVELSDKSKKQDKLSNRPPLSSFYSK